MAYTGLRDPPIANDDFATTAPNTPLRFSIVANDTGPDGTILPNTVRIPVT
ncbi:MAG: Ig-like domain-containing protein [Gammaproteobacteria bacterium]